MIRLMLCQFKQMLPFVLLWFALMLIFFSMELYTNRVDEMSYLAWCGEFCHVGSDANLVLFTVLLYLIASYSLFPREFDERTIDFVRSLPISRGRIYIAKVLAAVLLLCLLNVAEVAVQSVMLAFSTQSITGTKYWANDGWFLLRNCLFVFVVVSHSVFISWFRTSGLILYSGYMIGLMWLEQSLGYAGPYSLFRFFNNEYDGQTVLFDWPAIGFQLVMALVLLIMGYFLWTRTDSKPRTPGTKKFSAALPTLLSIGAFLLVATTLATLVFQAGTDRTSDNIQRTSTEFYQFAYRNRDGDRLLDLIKYVDADYTALAEMLNVQGEHLIQTDMTSQNSHAIGLASYKRIRMVLAGSETVNPELRRILSHETAHVFQGIESDRKLADAGNSTGFFVEGMAQYTSFKIVPDPPTRETNWAVSSESWKRNNITFEELAHRSAFESVYDPELLYGIGDIWVDAMARHCGEDSLGEFLRSTARKEAPRSIAGAGFWRHHLQHIGCELEQVNHLWRKQMQEIVDARSDGAFPSFTNVVITRKDKVVVINAEIEPDKTGLLPERFYLRVQSEAKLANTISPFRIGDVSDSGDIVTVQFAVPLSEVEGKRFRYQLGYVPYPDSRYYFEKWYNGSVPGDSE